MKAISRRNHFCGSKPEKELTGRTTSSKLVVIAVLLTLISGCGPKLESDGATIHVLVAASAASSVQAIAEAYSQQLPEGNEKPSIVVVSGPSSGLAQQILSGAPADIFLSASPRWTEAVKDRRTESAVLLGNRLVLATHRSNPGKIESLADLNLAGVGSIAVAGESVPVGQYANQAIQLLADGDRETVESKLVFAKDAAALVAWLMSNEVDAGFVYASDVNHLTDLLLIEMVEDKLHDPIVYYVAKITNERKSNESLRDDFYSWLQSEKAKAIFQESGFSLP